MIRFIYSTVAMPIAIFLYGIAELFSMKLRKRQETCNSLLDKLESEPARSESSGTRYWFHVSSMGEFEQIKALLEMLKKNKPQCFIVVTFFSPSGYENSKNFRFADRMLYMPFDTPHNAKRLLDIIRPNVAVFDRYDVWLNHLLECSKRNVALYLLNATAPRKKFPAAYYRKVYSLFDKIYAMNNDDVAYFAGIVGNERVTYLPDTRFDRIYGAVTRNLESPLFDKKTFEGKQVLVLGSSWQPDEDLVLKAVEILKSRGHKLVLILVPHEPTPEHINELCAKVGNYVLLSEVKADSAAYDISKVLIVDSIGVLLRLYAGATIAYVGGAFGVGVHSVTEPAGYAVPVICGAGYSNSPDAVELVKRKGLKSVSTADELADYTEKLITDETFYKEVSGIAGRYIKDNTGSTARFFEVIA